MRGTRNISAMRVHKRGAPRRADGRRRVRLWLPDTCSVAFREKCEQESRSVANDPLEAETLAQIAKAADTRGWK